MRNTRDIHSIDEVVEVAAQIVFEYEDWGCDHVWEMFKTYSAFGDDPPCETSDDLHAVCNLVDTQKRMGADWSVATHNVKEQLQALPSR